MLIKKKHSLIILLFLLLTRFIYKENSHLTTSSYQIKDSQIPLSFNHFKIINVSDLHNKSFGKHNKHLLQTIEKLKPDIIVVTGDLINAYKPNIEHALVFIKQASRIAPLYFISGNHEARLTNFEGVIQDLRNCGAIILNNKQISLKKNQDTIHLIGLTDPAFYFAENPYSILAYQLDYLLTNVKPTAYTLLLSHRPELMPIYSKRAINLVLSGHAHGGQFRLPLIGGIFAPNQGFFPKYTAGEYIEANTTMIVSRGLGPSSFPLRFNNKPDLVEIILNNKN